MQNQSNYYVKGGSGSGKTILLDSVAMWKGSNIVLDVVENEPEIMPEHE